MLLQGLLQAPHGLHLLVQPLPLVFDCCLRLLLLLLVQLDVFDLHSQQLSLDLLLLDLLLAVRHLFRASLDHFFEILELLHVPFNL